MPYIMRIPAPAPSGAAAMLSPSVDPVDMALIGLAGSPLVFNPAPAYSGADASGATAWRERSRLPACYLRRSTNATVGGMTNPTQGTAIGGQPTLKFTGATAMLRSGVPNIAANAFTFAMVIKPDSTVATAATRTLIGTDDNTKNGATDYIPWLAIFMGGNAASTLRFMIGSGAVRSAATTTISAGAAALVVMSYSAAQGINWRVNGAAAGSTATTQNLTSTTWQFAQNRIATAGAFIGDVGRVFVAADDYSIAARANDLATLESTLKTTYGIV